MKFKAIFDKYPDAKVILCTTDFAVNFAYKDDEEFIRFTKEKIDLRKYAKKHYENKQETIRFYLYNIVSIALKLEGFEFKYFTWNYDRYDYDNELSKELIEKVRELYREYLPLYHRLIPYVIHDSCFHPRFCDVFKKTFDSCEPGRILYFERRGTQADVSDKPGERSEGLFDQRGKGRRRIRQHLS